MPPPAPSPLTATRTSTKSSTTVVRSSGFPWKNLLSATSFAYSLASPILRLIPSLLLPHSGQMSFTMFGSSLMALFLLLTFVPRLADTSTPHLSPLVILSHPLLTQSNLFSDSFLQIGSSISKVPLCPL